MEKFGFNKQWKFHKFMSCGYPIILLLGVAAIGLFVVLPSRHDAFRFEFRWWVPLLVLALIVWALIEIRRFKQALAFSVELDEGSIRVPGGEIRWEDISRIEFKNGAGDNPAIILHTNFGTVLKVPGATDSIEYVRGFIEAHARNTSGA